jgi:hypothetical protein
MDSGLAAAIFSRENEPPAAVVGKSTGTDLSRLAGDYAIDAARSRIGCVSLWVPNCRLK